MPNVSDYSSLDDKDVFEQSVRRGHRDYCLARQRYYLNMVAFCTKADVLTNVVFYQEKADAFGRQAEVWS